MAHLVTMIEELLGRQVGFRALCDGAIDTTTASGELVFHIFSALAQFERRLIIVYARRPGRSPSPWQTRWTEASLRRGPTGTHGHTLYVDQQLSSADISQTLRISEATFYRYVALGRRATEGQGEAQGRGSGNSMASRRGRD